MNRLRTARRSARGVAVGAVAALALTASAAGTAVAAQPAQAPQQVTHIYECDEAIETFGLVSAFDCDQSPGAPRLGTIDGPFYINTPNGSWTCANGLAAVPVAVVGFGCDPAEVG
jgi:curli biogenesis system outer membrane secretion channel CsgG